eukprot:4508685-Prymnesium_polylepis.1
MWHADGARVGCVNGLRGRGTRTWHAFETRERRERCVCVCYGPTGRGTRVTGLRGAADANRARVRGRANDAT